jgi:hypothetical protein
VEASNKSPFLAGKWNWYIAHCVAELSKQHQHRLSSSSPLSFQFHSYSFTTFHLPLHFQSTQSITFFNFLPHIPYLFIMKFIIASAALVAAVTAAPINGTYTMPSSTTSTPSALVTVSAPDATYNGRPGGVSPSSGGTIRIKPSVISSYHISSGAVDYNLATGHLYKDLSSIKDVSALATFYISKDYEGKQCSFGFDADTTVNFAPNPVSFDVFTSQKPAWITTTSWPQGNLRDHHIGRMKLSANAGQAVYEDGHPTAAKLFPCPTGIIAGELVPYGENVDLCFTPSDTAGPYIEVHL